MKRKKYMEGATMCDYIRDALLLNVIHIHTDPHMVISVFLQI